MKTKAMVSLFMAFLLGVTVCDAASVINADNMAELKKYDKKTVTVTGIIEESSTAKTGKVRYLIFGRDLDSAFAVLIPTADLGKFTAKVGEPTDFYKGKKVKVKGMIRCFEGKPEMTVNSPAQISIIK